ncbi:WEB family protein [Glycine max]|nr:WEB family protein [Glycine max]
MKNDTAELKMEAEVTKVVLQDVETTLRVAVEEVEAANAAEASVVDKIKVLCMRTSPSHSSPSEPGARITISREEFESLVYKVKESDKLEDIKVAAATTTLKFQRLPKTKLSPFIYDCINHG